MLLRISWLALYDVEMNLRLMLVGMLLVATACSPGATSTLSPDSGGEPGAPNSGEGEASALLEFETPLLGGGRVSGSELAGKDVALWFWAPW